MIRSPHCSKCRLEPWQGRQRWCRRYRTTHERERRHRQFCPQRRPAPEPAAGPVLPPGVADRGWGVEICGARHQAGFPARPCGLAFPARRSGQAYCCKGHGAGQAAHSADCPLLQARQT